MEILCKTVNKPLRRRFIPKSKRTTPQLGKYTFLWDKIFKKWGWETKPESEKKTLRHSINEDLFGTYTKPSLLTNEQWSVMFYALEILYNDGILVWTDKVADLAREEGLRRTAVPVGHRTHVLGMDQAPLGGVVQHMAAELTTVGKRPGRRAVVERARLRLGQGAVCRRIGNDIGKGLLEEPRKTGLRAHQGSAFLDQALRCQSGSLSPWYLLRSSFLHW